MAEDAETLPCPSQDTKTAKVNASPQKSVGKATPQHQFLAIKTFESEHSRGKHS